MKHIFPFFYNKIIKRQYAKRSRANFLYKKNKKSPGEGSFLPES